MCVSIIASLIKNWLLFRRAELASIMREHQIALDRGGWPSCKSRRAFGLTRACKWKDLRKLNLKRLVRTRLIQYANYNVFLKVILSSTNQLPWEWKCYSDAHWCNGFEEYRLVVTRKCIWLKSIDIYEIGYLNEQVLFCIHGDLWNWPFLYIDALNIHLFIFTQKKHSFIHYEVEQLQTYQKPD